MRLLFYDDSPVFGGHEVMTLLGLEKILSETTAPVHFLASSANGKLIEKLEDFSTRFPALKVEALPWQSSKLEGLKNLLQRKRITILAEKLKTLSPTLVIAVQGNIEHSSLSLLAARKAKIPATSYIPVPHSHAEMGAKLGRLRDLFCRYLYRAADSFITITDEMAAMLKRRGATCPIHIVYNGVDTARFHPRNRAMARATLGLPEEKIIFGMVGRLEFKQKQQHLLAEAIGSRTSLKDRCHLIFAGDGPDKENLEALLKELGLSATLLPWTDPAGLYPALDALVIPSRYEGLPLVMLEALACGVTVLASDRDGMKDILPNQHRFTANKASAIAEVMENFISNGAPGPSEELIARVRQEMSLETFGNSFVETVFKLA